MSENKTSRLGTEPILPMLTSMAIPGIISALATYMYRTVDKIFVGNFVGTEALGGIGVLAPYNNVVIALMLFITVGGASQVSLTLGKKDYKQSNKLLTNLIVQAIIMALTISILFFVFAKDFVNICGVKEGTAIFDYAYSYLRVVVFGLVFNMLNQGLASIIRAEGNVKYSMFVSIIGSIFNVIFNYVFIVVLDFGIEGAALATVCSQLIGAICTGYYYVSKKSILKWVGFSEISVKLMLFVAKMGIAPSIFQVLSFAANIMLNKSLTYYGDIDPLYADIGGGALCISAIAIVLTVENLLTSLSFGVNQAVAPIIGYNYGAKLYKRVREASLTSQVMTFGLSIVIWLLMMITPDFLINIFSKGDTALIEFGSHAMRTAKIFALFTGYQMLVSMYFSAIGKPHIATVVSFSRNGIFLLPALLILPGLYGVNGVLYAYAISDGCSVIVVTILYLREMKRMDKKGKKQMENVDLNKKIVDVIKV